jgi:hypothetical protein
MKPENSQTSHHAGVQLTIFPSHTIELTNQTREERPLQKMNKHVPAFQLEASVRCQVRGTDAEVNAKRAQTVNRWLTAVIFESWGGREAPGGLREILNALCGADKRFDGSGIQCRADAEGSIENTMTIEWEGDTTLYAAGTLKPRSAGDSLQPYNANEK